ncbi:MAG: hypothetical protein WD068_01715 [Candidatus Babeliales bacterium]
MKKIIAYICFSISIPILSQTSHTIPFIGTITFPNAIRSIPTLCGYYKGTRFCTDSSDRNEFNTASFSIEETKNCTQLSLLVAANIVPSGLDKKIQGLKIPQGSNYLFYELNKKALYLEKDTCSYSWEITKKKLTDDRTLPEKTIIILLNPEFIESVSSPQWNPADNVVQLPLIAIAKTKTVTDQLQKAVATLRLAAMDLNAIHAPITTKIKHNDNATVSIIKN